MADEDIIETLSGWATKVAAEFKIDAPSTQAINQLLGTAGVAAHQVARPAAPVTTYLIGVALASDPSLTLETAVATIAKLAEES